jgi:hypothetical protein
MKTRKEIQSKKVAESPDVKAHLEAIKGIVKPPLFYLLGATVQTTGGDYPTSIITYKNLLFEARYENLAPSLDVSGVSSTGSDGKSVFRLTGFLPSYEIRRLAEPVNVIATPRGSLPLFLTAEYTFVTDPGTSQASDIEITVYAWDSNGNPAPDIAFDWRCRFQGFMVQLIW